MNADNCGVSRDGPGLGIYWVAGNSIWEANLDGTSPRAIVTGAHNPSGVTVSANHLYWTATAGDRGTIWQANLDGTSASPIDVGDYNPAGVAVNASHIYWSDTGGPPNRQGAIWEANSDGTGPHVIVPSQAVPFGVTVSASHLYWANSGDGTIWEANLTAAAPMPSSPASSTWSGWPSARTEQPPGGEGLPHGRRVLPRAVADGTVAERGGPQ